MAARVATRPSLLTALGLCVCLAPAAQAGPEYGVTGTRVTGDYGTGLSTVSEALTVHVAGGGRFRLRASLSLLRARGYQDLTWTGTGTPVLPSEEGRERRRSGAGGSGGAQGGGGQSEIRVEEEAGAVSSSSGLEPEGWELGLGDLWLGLSLPVAGGGAKLHRLGAAIDLKAPTAAEEELGTGEWDARVGLLAERYFWSVTLFGGAGWTRVGDPAWTELENVWDAYLGVEGEPVGPGLRWSVWGEGMSEAAHGAGGRLLIGVGLSSSGAVRWSASATAGLTSASRDVGFSMGLSWGTGFTKTRGAAPWHFGG